eukprot:scaffold91946_cov25-Phaeocystis_antarctica.AAC.1
MDSKKKSARLWRTRRTWNLEPTGTYSQRGRGTRTAEPCMGKCAGCRGRNSSEPPPLDRARSHGRRLPSPGLVGRFKG